MKEFYPDDLAGIPALESSEWTKGANKDPVTMSLNPKDRGSKKERASSQTFVIAKSRAELERELAGALAEIGRVQKIKDELLKKLSEAGIEPAKVENLPPAPPEPVKQVPSPEPVATKVSETTPKVVVQEEKPKVMKDDAPKPVAMKKKKKKKGPLLHVKKHEEKPKEKKKEEKPKTEDDSEKIIEEITSKLSNLKVEDLKTILKICNTA